MNDPSLEEPDLPLLPVHSGETGSCTVGLVVARCGSVRCVYTESIDLAKIGRLTIRRASHVEPDETGRWLADLAPVGGPRFGPYRHRSDALEAETDWLETHWLTPS